MASDVFLLHPTLNIMLNNPRKLRWHWHWISYSWNIKEGIKLNPYPLEKTNFKNPALLGLKNQVKCQKVTFPSIRIFIWKIIINYVDKNENIFPCFCGNNVLPEVLTVLFYAKYQVGHIFKYFLVFENLRFWIVSISIQMPTFQARVSVFVPNCNFSIKILGKPKLCGTCIKY